VGPAAGLLFRHADARRLWLPAVRFNGELVAPGDAAGSSIDSAEDHSRRDCGRRRHGPITGRPNGLPGLQARSIPVAEWTRGERPARSRPEGEASDLRTAARLSLRRSLHARLNRIVDLRPHAAGAAAKSGQATHHCDDNECGNQAVFNSSCTAIIAAQPAKSRSDSVHATLLWSTSTRQVYFEGG